jgi:hypothetical protein
MRNRTHTRLLIAALGCGGIAAALTASAPAHADPVENYVVATGVDVCQTLDDFPSFDGIDGIAMAIVKDTGWTYRQAGEVIELSIAADCIRHVPLWNRFVATYGPGSPNGQNPAQRGVQGAVAS